MCPGLTPLSTDCSHAHIQQAFACLDSHLCGCSWASSPSALLCCSQDSSLPTLISSVHRNHHLVMPEHQSRCEFQRGSVEIGLGPTGKEHWSPQGQDRAARATLAQPEDSRPPHVSTQQLWTPWLAARETSRRGGRCEAGYPPGPPCDGNCVNPSQPGRQAAEVVAPLWLLLGWAQSGGSHTTPSS